MNNKKTKKRSSKMKQMIQLTLMVSFLVNGIAVGDDGDSSYLRDGRTLNFGVDPIYETTVTAAPSRDFFQLIVARISNNPLSGLEILETTPPSLSWHGSNGESLPFRNNEEIEEFLRTAKIVSQKRVGEGINNPLKVLLEKDGIQMYAVFRDVRVESNQRKMNDGTTKYFFRDDARFECAAYELSKLLGLKTVPPAVERRIRGKKGTLQAWVENVTTEKALRKETDVPPSGGVERWRWIMQRQNIYIFDNLIYNEDRNLGNILIEPDWKLWMIDHTRAFRRWKELPNPDKIQFAERGLWEKLLALDETLVRERLQKFINTAEMNGLIERTSLLVDHIQELIEDRGEKAVLFTLR
jgi:hypothetical protein